LCQQITIAFKFTVLFYLEPVSVFSLSVVVARESTLETALRGEEEDSNCHDLESEDTQYMGQSSISLPSVPNYVLTINRLKYCLP
jgi:hypothetical protein